MNQFKWIVAGDIDGFFGLMLDNLLQLLVLTALCSFVCGMPPEFVFSVVLPGVGISLLFGNIFYALQARKLAIQENRNDVTALPYGINTISLFAFIFFVIFPVFKATGDYKTAWKIGLLACFISGVIEFAGSFIAHYIRSITPRAALLSALSGIAITFISMEFMIKTYKHPLVAFLPFGIILLQYFGKFKYPFHIPGGFLSIAAGTSIAWLAGYWGEPMMKLDALKNSFSQAGIYFPNLSMTDLFDVFTLQNIKEYSSVILPMGLFNVIGSLQNIESAEASGDKFETRSSLAMNGVGTIIGSFFGSPFPTTIYIGHPGWKALGARAGYSVLNGIFMTILCLFGLMSVVQALVPIEAGMAIILWIGIIIGAQCFETSPTRHAPAIILGLFPALAGWGVLMIQSVFNFANGELAKILAKENITTKYSITMQSVSPGLEFLPYSLAGILSLSQGFLIISMIWASICAFIIDQKFRIASYWCLAGSVLSSTGIIHSYKLADNAILNEYSFPSNMEFIVAYFLLAVLLFSASLVSGNTNEK
ncbi:MAG TPA: NCS2 family permease [Leptospiraceae bacterium]|nr:NCS2 family permease [Leptospiraceae bacterium]HMW03884.1 NCS2 family permease [Leptospiraceae bacterium]HMX32402.1 NCS2 family permease [Leptospiraceae bacterium]HMY29864.1 NCS2 family permease [Leptospiraceae bacterium]HMZ62992.1 NCS2 family permease [Leptospiraceae bacterium]